MDKVTIPSISCAELVQHNNYAAQMERNKLSTCWKDNKLIVDCEDASQISDGYHTFEQLYKQRLYLSATLATSNPFAWKSKRHSDGEVPFGGGWFIMGWYTPVGQYTYHYKLEDWDMFHCKELEHAPEWDGHTCEDVDRLISLPWAKEIRDGDTIYFTSKPEQYEYTFLVECFQELAKIYPDNKVLYIPGELEFVEPEKWEFRGNDRGYFCPHCGGGCLWASDGDWMPSSFCPHCGAPLKYD